MKTYNIPTGTLLYRYDLEEPPTDWSMNHYNPEYIYDGMKKNMFYGNFFFNSEEMAKRTALVAIKKSGLMYKGAWITSCKLRNELQLLDFRHYLFITEVLYDFYLNHLDILNDNFTCTGCANSNSLLDLKEIVNEYCNSFHNLTSPPNEQVLKVAERCIKKVEKFYVDNSFVGILIQKLSDFNNGVSFKQILQQKNYEGFIFNESDHRQGSDTVCIFSPENLSSPQKLFIQLDNL